MGSRLFLICVLFSIVLVSAEIIEESKNARVTSEEPVRARGKRDFTYTGPAVISNPTRVSFPNYGDDSIGSNSPPYIGFKIPPGTTLTQTRYANESFVYWDMTTNTIVNNVAYGCGVNIQSTKNSFCSILPLPDYDSASDTNVYPLINEITPVPHLAMTFSCPADGESRAFLTIWISEESFLDGGLLVATYQYFYGSPGLNRRTGRYLAPACLPVVNKISPGFAFVQGSVIFLEGQNFGVDPSLVSIAIGDNIQCTGIEMVVPNSVMRCIAAGSGTNLIVNVTVESSSTVAPFQLLSFNANCPLICTAGAYPDPTCASCIRPQSSTDDVGTSRLSQVVSSVSSDLVEATYFSDMTFYATAVRYQQNSVMQVLSIPRYTVPDVTVDMKFAIVATSPLKITALTGLLQGYDTEVIPTLELHYESQQAQWTKVDNNGTTSYRLDLI